MIHYMDSSAFMKLVLREDHSDALITWVESGSPDIALSELVVAECMRTSRRLGPQVVVETRAALTSFRMRTMSAEIWRWAGEIDPHSLRTLDALHLSVALSFGAHLESVVTYDTRLTEACTAYGIRVLAPV